MDAKKKKNTKILIVDDSDFSRSQIASMLQDYNIVGEAPSAKEAITIMHERTVHIAIIDVVMPEISGIELAEHISENFDDISIIMISSLGQENIIIDSISAGASDYLQKPISEHNLIASIDKLAQKYDDEDE